MFEAMPVLVSAFCRIDESGASVRFAGENDAQLAFSLVHQDAFPDHLVAVSYLFGGDSTTPHIPVRDQDSLTLIARRNGDIVASQVYEVDLSLAECNGYLLIPRGGYNILCDQECLREPEHSAVPHLTIHGPVHGAAILEEL